MAVKGIRVLLLSVSRDKGFKSITRKGVSTRSDSFLLVNYTVGTTSTYSVNLTRILTIVIYYLNINTKLTTLIEFSRLLLEALFSRNDNKGVNYNLSFESYAVIASLRYLLRVLGRSKLLAYYTSEGVSSIDLGLGRILLI